MSKQQVIYFSDDGCIQWKSELVDQWLKMHFSDWTDHEKLPLEFWHWIEKKRKKHTSVSGHGCKPLVYGNDENYLIVEFVSGNPEEKLLLLSHEGRALPVSSKKKLSPRESEILGWVAETKTNAEIGQILDLSTSTINKHVEKILRKLGVENRYAAALLFLKNRSD